MKKISLAILLTLICLLFSTTALAHTEDAPYKVDLLAGQDMDIGDVLVWNDGEMLYVQFISDVCMLETHLHIATSLEGIPQTKKLNPIPGQFDYSTYHGCSKDFTYEIPLAWDFETELFLAAHASLGKEMTMTIFSDGGANILVTAGNQVGAVYPFPAVDAWEHSTWNSRLTIPFALGDWVWESYRTNNPTVTENVTFKHDFTVPGFPLSGVLHIATDNMYSASLNGIFVGEQTNYNLWYQVGEYDFMPLEGANTFQVIGTNYGDASYNIDSNPAGLIYEAEITYLESNESAWGNGLAFDGKNWATYFNYTVQEPPQPTCPEIVNASGNIEVLDYIPTDVRVGAFENDTYVRVWKEFEGILTADLPYDLAEGKSARSFGPTENGGAVPTGTDVCVYYVHLDNVGPSSTVSKTGYLEFSGDIAGLIISGGNIGTFANENLMFAADTQIGYPGTTYPDGSTIYPPNIDYLRGFDVYHPNNLDDAVFNGGRVDFTMWVVNAHDSMRVILPLIP